VSGSTSDTGRYVARSVLVFRVRTSIRRLRSTRILDIPFSTLLHVEKLISSLLKRIQIDMLLITIFLLFLEHNLESFNFSLGLFYLFLLLHQLFHKHLSFRLLLIKIILQLPILIHQILILFIDPLSDVRNQLKMMLEFIFPLPLLSRLIPSHGLLLLDGLLRATESDFVLSGQLTGLLLLELLDLLDVLGDVAFDLVVQAVCHLVVFCQSVRFLSVPNPELPLEMSDLSPVLLLILLVSLGSAFHFAGQLGIFVLHLFDVLLQFEILFVPLVVVYFVNI
jgi:hypothetical protein